MFSESSFSLLFPFLSFTKEKQVSFETMFNSLLDLYILPCKILSSKIEYMFHVSIKIAYFQSTQLSDEQVTVYTDAELNKQKQITELELENLAFVSLF